MIEVDRFTLFLVKVKILLYIGFINTANIEAKARVGRNGLNTRKDNINNIAITEHRKIILVL